MYFYHSNVIDRAEPCIKYDKPFDYSEKNYTQNVYMD